MSILKIDEMSILEIVDKVNIALSVDGNFTRVAKELFEKSESTLRKKLRKAGYKRIGNEYILADDNIHTEVRQPFKTQPELFNELIDNKNSNNQKEYEDNMNLVISINIKDKILELAKNYDRILSAVEQLENSEYDKEYEDEYDNGIIIKLPIETIKDYRATARINNIVWEQFDEFCKANKEYTKRDLLSMALVEYMQKYTKE